MAYGNEVTRMLLERAAKAGKADAIAGRARRIVHPRKCIQDAYDLEYEKHEGTLAHALISVDEQFNEMFGAMR